MPDFNHPPFVTSAQQQPRTLWRWLDINPIGGPLGRAQTFLTLPVFNIVGINYIGYGDIVQSYNFTGPNNFSLKPITNIPINPNYSLAISYADKYGNVYRYFLWTAAGAVLYFQPVYYTGQKIGKNCRFEVWSTGATASQAPALQFYTSVLGIQDYRFAVDSDLTIFSSSCTTPGFTYDGAQLDQGLPVSTTDWWVSSMGLVSGNSWTPEAGTGSIATDGDGGTVSVDPARGKFFNVGVGDFTTFTLSGELNPANSFYIIIVCDYAFGPGGGTRIEFVDSGSANIFTITADDDGTNGTITFNGTTIVIPGVTDIASNYITGLKISIVGTLVTLIVYDPFGDVIGTANQVIAPFNVSKIILNDVNQLFEVAHVPDNTFNFLDHLTYNYGGFKFPFTFTANAVVPTNT